MKVVRFPGGHARAAAGARPTTRRRERRGARSVKLGLDGGDALGRRRHRLRLLVGDLNVERLLDRHDELDCVEAVRAEVLGEAGRGGDAPGFDAELRRGDGRAVREGVEAAGGEVGGDAGRKQPETGGVVRRLQGETLRFCRERGWSLACSAMIPFTLSSTSSITTMPVRAAVGRARWLLRVCARGGAAGSEGTAAGALARSVAEERKEGLQGRTARALPRRPQGGSGRHPRRIRTQESLGAAQGGVNLRHRRVERAGGGDERGDREAVEHCGLRGSGRPRLRLQNKRKNDGAGCAILAARALRNVVPHVPAASTRSGGRVRVRVWRLADGAGREAGRASVGQE